MYSIARSVIACLQADTHVDVAWVVDTEGFAIGDRTDAVALTPGGGRIGTIAAGALDGPLADIAGRAGPAGRFLDVPVSPVDALVAGLGADADADRLARCLVVPASSLPTELWDLLVAREPIALVAHLDGREVVKTEVFTTATIGSADADVGGLFDQRTSAAIVASDRVVTVLRPVPTLVLVGGGPFVDALGRAAALLDWRVQTISGVEAVTGVVAGLAPMDALVVAGHDDELVGRVLAAAVAGDVGYIGALGPRKVQEQRARWLAYRGVTDLDRIHGPAGIDIGATTPAEAAISVLAEVLAERGGRTIATTTEGERDDTSTR